MKLNVIKTEWKVGKRIAIDEEMHEVVAVEKDKCYWVYPPYRFYKLQYLWDRYIIGLSDRRKKIR